jgi:hypothetical protein
VIAGLEAEDVEIIVTNQTTIPNCKRIYENQDQRQGRIGSCRLSGGSIRFGKYQNKATKFGVSLFCGTRRAGWPRFVMPPLANPSPGSEADRKSQSRRRVY